MRKLPLILALFMAASATVNAQDNKSKSAATATVKAEANATEMTARRQTDALDKIVNLSDSQRETIYNMNLTLAHRTQIINNSEASDKARALKDIETFRETSMMQHLNEEQRAKYRAATAGK